MRLLLLPLPTLPQMEPMTGPSSVTDNLQQGCPELLSVSLPCITRQRVWTLARRGGAGVRAAEWEAGQGGGTAGHAPTLLGKSPTDATCGQKLRVATGRPLVPEPTIIGTPPEYRQCPQELGITTQNSQGWNTWAVARQFLEPGIPWGSCNLLEEQRDL